MSSRPKVRSRSWFAIRLMLERWCDKKIEMKRSRVQETFKQLFIFQQIKYIFLLLHQGRFQCCTSAVLVKAFPTHSLWYHVLPLRYVVFFNGLTEEISIICVKTLVCKFYQRERQRRSDIIILSSWVWHATFTQGIIRPTRKMILLNPHFYFFMLSI